MQQLDIVAGLQGLTNVKSGFVKDNDYPVVAIMFRELLHNATSYTTILFTRDNYLSSSQPRYLQRIIAIPQIL